MASPKEDIDNLLAGLMQKADQLTGKMLQTISTKPPSARKSLRVSPEERDARLREIRESLAAEFGLDVDWRDSASPPSTSAPAFNANSEEICGFCNTAIGNEDCLVALDRVYHIGHLRCAACGCNLSELSFYQTTRGVFCSDCYGRAFCMPCGRCQAPIMSTEVVSALGAKFHPECFVCSGCSVQLADLKFFQPPGNETAASENAPKQVFCEFCYYYTFGDRCFECDEFIHGDAITALGRKFHIEHFCCHGCGRVLVIGEKMYEHLQEPCCGCCYSNAAASGAGAAAGRVVVVDSGWTSDDTTNEQWSEQECSFVDDGTGSLQGKAKIPLLVPCRGFHVEVGVVRRRPTVTSVPVPTGAVDYLSFIGRSAPRYARDLAWREHENYISLDPRLPAIISLERKSVVIQGTRDPVYRAVIRTPRMHERIVLPGASSLKERIRTIKNRIVEKSGGFQHVAGADIKLARVKGQEIVADLVRFEEKLLIKKTYSFGILYAKAGQRTEVEMYANRESSPAFEEFLGLLGKRITPDGRGGEAKNSQSMFSYHTELEVPWDATPMGASEQQTPPQASSPSPSRRADTAPGSPVSARNQTALPGNEERGLENKRKIGVFFHVSTHLPYTDLAIDPQQVERKRFLGNDVVLLIFKDAPSESASSGLPDFISPDVFTSHVNQVFAVVRPVKKNNVLYYKVAFASKHGVPPHKPQIPAKALFKADQTLRDFLLAKMINAEHCAMFAPEFAHAMQRTQKEMLEEIIKKHRK